MAVKTANNTVRREVAEELVGKLPGCTLGWKFGHASLQVDDKVFAFTRPDEGAAIKLPAERIAELVEDDEIKNLKMGQRTMREWVVIPHIAEPGNLPLLREAMAFMGSLPKTKQKKTARPVTKAKPVIGKSSTKNGTR